ncbi:unnamed protein product [Calypogeia fissa]
MKQAFGSKTEMVFVSNGGSAIVRGAVLYGVAAEWTEMVATRIAAKTIGFDTSWPFIEKKHRQDYMVMDRSNDNLRFCDKIFGILIRKGQAIPRNYVRKEIFMPLYRKGHEFDGDDIEVNLYEAQTKKPMYVTDTGVKKLATCCISVPKIESLGRNPQIELSVHFGTILKASVEGKNFSGQRVCMPPVKMKWITLDADI